MELGKGRNLIELKGYYKLLLPREKGLDGFFSYLMGNKPLVLYLCEKLEEKNDEVLLEEFKRYERTKRCLER